MSYRLEKETGDLVISGFEQGIAPSPHQGIANMQGVNIATEQGEAMCSFGRVAQSTQVSGSGTLTQVNTNTVSISGVNLLVGSVITITNPAPPTSLSVKALVVAGGGGGGTDGGGGAGGYQYNSSVSVTATSYNVVVGSGGAGGTFSGPGSVGNNSTFSTITANAGGYGGAGAAGGNGGCGGGGGSNAHAGGTGSQGFAGGTAAATNGGGGGGTFEKGANANGGGGRGGNGTPNNIQNQDIDVYYGGGGGGGGAGAVGGAGGLGGGGAGSTDGSGGNNATANTGGGGGGSTSGVGGGTGGNGGSGIVIIRYTTSPYFSCTGGTITTDGTSTVHTFTSNGTFTVSAVPPSPTPTTTGLSGDYYYLSTGKLYAGSLPPNDPDLATAVTGISAGTATFDVKYSFTKPLQTVTEIYNDSNNTRQYRYYVLDDSGNIWCQDTHQLVNWVTPVWFFVGSKGVGSSGLGLIDGWITVAVPNGAMYWKMTSLLGTDFVQSFDYTTSNNHVTLTGHQGKLYGTDGNFISSLFPNTSILTGGANIQSYASYGNTLSSDQVTNGNFTGGTSGWSLGVMSLTLTAVVMSGDTSATLTGNWNYPTATQLTTFSSGEQRYVLFTNGSTALTWVTALTQNATASITTLGPGWAYGTNNVVKGADGTGALTQFINSIGNQGDVLELTFTISNWTVGTVTPSFGDVSSGGTAVGANGTYTQILTIGPTPVDFTLKFTPTNTSRFTIDTISLKKVTTGVNVLIGGSEPTLGSIHGIRIPAYFFSSATLPSSLTINTIYYIDTATLNPFTFKVYTAASGGSPLDLVTGATGDQYFNTFDPNGAADGSGNFPFTFTAQRLNLPFYDIATAMAELGNIVVVGGISNTIYPWDQVSALPQNLLFLPENNTASIITVNNTGYIFAGFKGNIYITNGSAISRVMTVPDYCAGIPGSPSTYIEPYFTWGGTMYVRGRVYFSILDQTATKVGNCGGIWSFVPTENFFIGQDTGLSLRMENQNSYGTYSGVATILFPSQNQNAIGTQYFAGWYSSVSAPTYGIDFSGTTPQIAIIETDLIPTGTMLSNETFEQIEYKLGSPLQAGESVQLYYRKNNTESYSTCGSVNVLANSDGEDKLAGYFVANFENTQWLQLKAILTPLFSSSTSFCRLKEIRVR